ncbi:MAG: ATP-binding protein [Algisphaera sp.]
MDDCDVSGSDGVDHLVFHKLEEVPSALARLIDCVKAHGYDNRAVFALRLSLEEVLTNAVRHGNGGDTNKQVTVVARITDEKAEFDIEDEGEGFKPAEVPDPRSDENLLRPHGRGVMLINAYMTEVRYNERGNRVTLVKRRDCDRPQLDDEEDA